MASGLFHCFPLCWLSVGNFWLFVLLLSDCQPVFSQSQSIPQIIQAQNSRHCIFYAGCAFISYFIFAKLQNFTINEKDGFTAFGQSVFVYCCSNFKICSLRLIPAAYPVRLPFLPMTRSQGITMAMGLW